jgi:hypothetical protein
MIPLTKNRSSWNIHVLPSHICQRQYTHPSAKWSSVTAFLSEKALHAHRFHAWNSRCSTFNNHDSFSHHAAHNTKHTTNKQPIMNDKQCTTRIIPFVKARRRFMSQLCTPNCCVRDSLTHSKLIQQVFISNSRMIFNWQSILPDD